MSQKEKAKPSEHTQDFAMYIAMVVRNAMEDFHSEHLSDEQENYFILETLVDFYPPQLNSSVSHMRDTIK